MIPALVPALTLVGFQARSTMPPNEVTSIIEAKRPGYTARTCRTVQGEVYDRLRKRYLVDTLGQSMGQPSGVGLAPPPVSFVGVPLRGDLELVMAITTPGPLGTALFSLSLDGGTTVAATGLVTSAATPLPGTGVSAIFPAGAYDASNVYTASTPVPEIILGWITSIAEPRMWGARGANAADPQIVAIQDRCTLAQKLVQEAADSDKGLYDLPLNADAGGSGVTQGSPLGYSETSPYTWQDEQAARGRSEDRRRYCP